ncbi:MAG: hypothetical protein OHK0039_47600 [Bacteroidia bacterium]
MLARLLCPAWGLLLLCLVGPLLRGQGIYAGGVDDGYDYIALDVGTSLTGDTLLARWQVYPQVLHAGATWRIDLPASLVWWGEVCDAQGRCVLRLPPHRGAAERSWPLALAAGWYCLCLHSEAGSRAFPLICLPP